jgi:hypothetical protein
MIKDDNARETYNRQKMWTDRDRGGLMEAHLRHGA